MLLVLVGVCTLPALLAGMFTVPDVGGGLALAAMAPCLILRSPYGDEGGGGAGVMEFDEFQGKVLRGVEYLTGENAKLKSVANQHAQKLQSLERRGLSGRGAAVPGQVSEDCARFLFGVMVAAGIKSAKLNATRKAQRGDVPRDADGAAKKVGGAAWIREVK